MSVRDDIIIALVDDLKDLVNNPTFDNPKIAEVKRFWPILDSLGNEEFPLIVVDDNGSQPGPEHAGVARFTTYLNINCIVRADTDPELATEVEHLAHSVLKYLYSEPSLHSQALDLMVVESEDQGAYSTVSGSQANIMHRIRVIWYDTVRTVTSSGDTDVYGVQWLDTARDKLVTRLNTLKTTMASGYTPTFDNVYARHRVPDMAMNAVSVGLDSVEQNHFADSGSAASIFFYVKFSVRVHTGYDDELIDDQEVGRLVNSIINHLRNKIDLADDYQLFDIEDVDTGVVFDESGSKGGQFKVTIAYANQFTQE